MKIANIDCPHIFWTTWGIAMKFLEKMWIIISKVAKKANFTAPGLEDTFFEKPHWPLSIFRANYLFLLLDNISTEKCINLIFSDLISGNKIKVMLSLLPIQL